jgi:hypothetical protein
MLAKVTLAEKLNQEDGARRHLEADWKDIGYMLVTSSKQCINECLGDNMGMNNNVYCFVGDSIGGFCCSDPKNPMCQRGTYCTSSANDFKLKEWMCVMNQESKSLEIGSSSSLSTASMQINDKTLFQLAKPNSDSNIKQVFKSGVDYQKYEFKLDSELIKADPKTSLFLKVEQLEGCKVTILKSKQYGDKDDLYRKFEVNL